MRRTRPLTSRSHGPQNFNDLRKPWWTCDRDCIKTLMWLTKKTGDLMTQWRFDFQELKFIVCIKTFERHDIDLTFQTCSAGVHAASVLNAQPRDGIIIWHKYLNFACGTTMNRWILSWNSILIGLKFKLTRETTTWRNVIVEETCDAHVWFFD